MIGRNFIVKNAKNFPNTMQEIRLKIPYRYPKIVKKKRNDFTQLLQQ